jgi:hypothetical protein
MALQHGGLEHWEALLALHLRNLWIVLWLVYGSWGHRGRSDAAAQAREAEFSADNADDAERRKHIARSTLLRHLLLNTS